MTIPLRVAARVETGGDLADALATLMPLEQDLAYASFASIAARTGADVAPQRCAARDAATPGFSMELLEPERLATSDSAIWKQIAEWGARSFDRSPFAFDASLPLERSLAIYQTWTEKVMRGDGCDGVVLVRHEGEVVAFISFQLLCDVSEAAGPPVIGRCLAATLPASRGLATACVRETAPRRPLGAAHLEGETPITTFGTVSLFARTGFRSLRATAYFHRRFEPRRDP